jgi:hypothetical protein
MAIYQALTEGWCDNFHNTCMEFVGESLEDLEMYRKMQNNKADNKFKSPQSQWGSNCNNCKHDEDNHDSRDN